MAHAEEIRTATALVGDAAVVPSDLAAPALYLNRELTWLAFERRVLHEALDTRNPLLERVKFLAITASNLDEFFMKRIGGLKHQVAAGVQEPTVDGRTPQQQMLVTELLRLLAEHDIEVSTYERLSSTEQAELREQYLGNVFPLVTPLA